jgi:hypothetical protein
MRTYQTLITFDQHQWGTWGGVPLAGRTFPVVSVFHDEGYGTLEIRFMTFLGLRSCWLDMTHARIGRREVIRDYGGMRGALMDRVAAGEPLEAFMDLLVSATGVAAILRRQNMPSLAAKLDDTVGLVLGAAPQQKITCSECGRVVTITGGGFEWGHFSDCPMVSCADEDIDLDLSAMDDFTIYDDSPSERP